MVEGGGGWSETKGSEEPQQGRLMDRGLARGSRLMWYFASRLITTDVAGQEEGNKPAGGVGLGLSTLRISGQNDHDGGGRVWSGKAGACGRHGWRAGSKEGGVSPGNGKQT